MSPPEMLTSMNQAAILLRAQSEVTGWLILVVT